MPDFMATIISCFEIRVHISHKKLAVEPGSLPFRVGIALFFANILKASFFSAGLFLLQILFPATGSTQPLPVYGVVLDASSGEALPGATVYLKIAAKGAITDKYGYFTINGRPGDTLVVQFIGYKRAFLPLNESFSPPVSIRLSTAPFISDEVVVVSEAISNKDRAVSSISFSPMQLTAQPSFMGQRDLFKSMQTLPGVQPGTEGSAGLYVRGGTNDQVQVMIDGVPLFNVFHSSGFVSVLHPGTMHSADFYAGGFPAKFGGRLSSVLDITMKEGNKSKISGALNLGVISADALMEIPLKKDRHSVLLSVRKSTLNELTKRTEVQGRQTLPKTDFHDITAKFSFSVGRTSKLTFTYFDALDFINTSRFISRWDSTIKPHPKLFEAHYDGETGWKTRVLSTHFRTQLSPKLVVRTGGFVSAFASESAERARAQSTEKYTGIVQSLYKTKNSFNTGIIQWNLFSDGIYHLNDRNTLEAGFRGGPSRFTTGSAQFSQTGGGSTQNDTTVKQMPEYDSREFDVYLSHRFSTNRISIQTGARTSFFQTGNRLFSTFQPRLNVNFALTDQLFWKNGFSVMTQPVHAVTNTGAGLISQLWIPSVDEIIPQRGWLAVTGFTKEFQQNITASAEFYYRKLFNLVEYKQGASFYTSGNSWLNQVEQGNGNSFGLELFLRKHAGRFTGSIAYTLSKTSWYFETINNGRPYPAKFDRRHNLTITGAAWLTKNISVASNFTGYSGHWISSPDQMFLYNIWDPTIINANSGIPLDLYVHRNNFQMPAYFRSDISVSGIYPQKNFNVTFNAGLYNSLNRFNPMFARYEPYVFEQPGMVMIPLFPRLPFVSLGVEF
jgi:hypothetical protein